MKLPSVGISTRASRKKLREYRRKNKLCLYCGKPRGKFQLCTKCKTNQRIYKLTTWDNDPKPKLRVMTCSGCGRKGHNTRTCEFRRKARL